MGAVTWVLKGAATQIDTYASLADGSTALSSEVDNETDLYRWLALEVKSDFGTNPDADGHFKGWIILSHDGTNYEDGTGGAPGTIPDRAPDFIVPLGADTAQQKWAQAGFAIPPLKFKLLLLNAAGQTTTATAADNEISERRYNETVA